MDVYDTVLTVGNAILYFVTGLFALSVLIRRNDIADIGWGIGILLVAITSFLMQSENTLTLRVLLILASLWSIRLAVRILYRNIRKTEDSRYGVWRKTWGSMFYIRSYIQIFLLQGFLMILVGYPFIHASVYARGVETSVVYMWIGIGVWVIGYFFEVVGDYELDSFLKKESSRGKILDTGLWKYTRHPNYFGEVTMWWGIWLIVAPLPHSVIALIGPLTITFLILKVSGIPMLEKKFSDNPKFLAYKERTSAFFPLPRKMPTK